VLFTGTFTVHTCSFSFTLTIVVTFVRS
jgi:hypothetical protein